MGREHPRKERGQLVGEHHSAVQKQAASRSSKTHELLGDIGQVSNLA
jgi:hypothetical protein